MASEGQWGGSRAPLEKQPTLSLPPPGVPLGPLQVVIALLQFPDVLLQLVPGGPHLAQLLLQGRDLPVPIGVVAGNLLLAPNNHAEQDATLSVRGPLPLPPGVSCLVLLPSPPEQGSERQRCP